MTRDHELDPRFVKGVAHFNAGAFFAAHEVWEDLWHDCHDATRSFYQGLIQVAVCLHHFRNRNTRCADTLPQRNWVSPAVHTRLPADRCGTSAS